MRLRDAVNKAIGGALVEPTLDGIGDLVRALPTKFLLGAE